MRDRIDAILKFWFEESGYQKWFGKDESFDNDIREQFTDDYQKAANGDYDDWAQHAKGCLALMILLDQFPRNMFRDTPKMYATDVKALEIAKQAVANGLDQGLTTDEKAFLYLPFEHSEELSDQRQSLDLFEAMRDENQTYYDYAVKHYEVVERYGRFPHRNVILGRTSTPEEQAYIANGGGF